MFPLLRPSTDDPFLMVPVSPVLLPETLELLPEVEYRAVPESLLRFCSLMTALLLLPAFLSAWVLAYSASPSRFWSGRE